jgi:hypothetical protein
MVDAVDVKLGDHEFELLRHDWDGVEARLCMSSLSRI